MGIDDAPKRGLDAHPGEPGEAVNLLALSPSGPGSNLVTMVRSTVAGSRPRRRNAHRESRAATQGVFRIVRPNIAAVGVAGDQFQGLLFAAAGEQGSAGDWIGRGEQSVSASW